MVATIFQYISSRTDWCEKALSEATLGTGTAGATRDASRAKKRGREVRCKSSKTWIIQFRHIDGYSDFKPLVSLPGKWHYYKLTNMCSQSPKWVSVYYFLICFVLLKSTRGSTWHRAQAPGDPSQPCPHSHISTSECRSWNQSVPVSMENSPQADAHIVFHSSAVIDAQGIGCMLSKWHIQNKFNFHILISHSSYNRRHRHSYLSCQANSHYSQGKNLRGN